MLTECQAYRVHFMSYCKTGRLLNKRKMLGRSVSRPNAASVNPVAVPYTSFNAGASSPALLPARRPKTMPALRLLPPI